MLVTRLVAAAVIFMVGVGSIHYANYLFNQIIDEVNASIAPDERFRKTFTSMAIRRKHRELFPQSSKRSRAELWSLIAGLCIFFAYFIVLNALQRHT
jgi:hypothetical protein